MPKAKKTKAKNLTKNKKLISEKQKALQMLLEVFQDERAQHEAYFNNLCKETCERISKAYNDKLKALPENICDMTLLEYIEAQRKTELEEPNTTDLHIITSEFAKSKLISEKKKELKKNRSERKQSLSSSVCSSKRIPTNLSRTFSESSLNTPRLMMSSFVITPKFNPRLPVRKDFVRKPRAGEVVLSVSGSPIQNFADDVAISLGAGNIIKIADDTEISKLDGEFMKKLDETTKLTLENVKNKLDLILKV